MIRYTSVWIRLAALTACIGGALTAAAEPGARVQRAKRAGGRVLPSIGPDAVISEADACIQYGREGPVGSGTIGLGISARTCNEGDEPLHWFGLPDTRHPLFAQNMYRLMTVNGTARFEQLGMSWMKHADSTGQDDGCSFACTPFPDSTQLGVGCSDVYGPDQNSTACRMGPRSAIHPYTGELLSGGCDLSSDCSSQWPTCPSRNHVEHVHDGISHRLQVRDVDLIRSLNPSARYFGEVQGPHPHEYAAGNGNQNNNVSHQEFIVSGPHPRGVFGFVAVGETVVGLPAINAWPGASQTMIEPAPLLDGRAFLVYTTSDLGDGLWHYEYALYNMHLDLSLGSLSIPVPGDVTISSIGFHAPLNHAPELHADNYTNDPWEVVTTGGAVTWSTDSFAVDPLANAVRWGTVYNFRFDADAPPQAVDATVGLFKTGDVAPAATVGPSSVGPRDCNANSIDDRCDLDCNPPGCTVVGCGQSEDCTSNGIPDECEADCNSNAIADRCELFSGTAGDCNGNGVPDECDPGGETDCNMNEAVDFCDLLLGTSHDYNENGVPDECDPQLGTIYVDDDGTGDPGPGDTTVSDPAEDGSQEHPYDAIQEAIDVSGNGDVVLLADGTYTGPGNQNITYGGRTITVRSQNGPDDCILDLEFAARGFDFISWETPDARLEGLTILNALGDPNFPSNPAIYVGDSSPTIFNCVISGSNSVAIRIGGFSDVTVANCRITDNRLSGIYCSYGNPSIRNTLLSRHGSAGIWLASPTAAAIYNCTITDESTGVSTYGSNLTIRNSIIWGNTAAQVFGYADIRHSNVQGGSAGIGNIDADPLFVDAEGGNYRLSSSSPSIDAGDNGATCPMIDLDGNPRFLDDPDTADTGSGVPPIVDMGAYEFVPDDCNDNGTPDAAEILLDPNLDSNGNGVLDECEPSFPDCNDNGRPDFCEPDCNANGIQDECDIADLTSSDCNANSVPDECDLDGGGSHDCDANQIPDECQPDADGDTVPDVCDACPGFDDRADCDNDSIPDECEIGVDDGGLCTGDECSSDCTGNGFPDECDIAAGAPDRNGNGIPDECEAPAALALPADPAHQGAKHRYLSIDTSSNPARDVGSRVELVSMRRCSGLLGRACRVDDDCEAAVPGSGTCIEHPDVGTAGPWWVQAPQQEQLGCHPGPCGDEDWFARVDSVPYFDTWTLSTLHIGDCEIIPAATYEIRACSPPDGVVCSDALTIGTIEQPFVSPGFRGNYGDAVGPVEGTAPDLYFTPPDGLTNVVDVTAHILTKQNYGTPNKPQTHPTWVDLHGLGDGNPPQPPPPNGNPPNYINNVSDLGQILKAFVGDAWTDDPGNMDPGQCP